MKLIIRWAVITLALFATVYFVPGITVGDPNAWIVFVVMALILGLVNAFIRPIISALSCGLIVLTLGLFTLVINGLMLWLASWITTDWLGLEFNVDGFWNAVLGALIISVVSVIVSTFVGKKRLGKR